MQLKISIFVSLFLFLVVCPIYAQTDSSDPEKEWEFAGSIYLWGANIGGQTINGSEAEVEFSDLVTNLEMAFMGAFVVRKNKWSILADVIYMDISADNTTDVSIPVGPIHVPVTTATNVDLTGLILHFVGGYELYSNSKFRLDLVGGVRYLDLDMDLFLELESLGPGQSRTISESITDLNGIVGLKGQVSLGERWYLPYYLDMGTGGSTFTWQGTTGIGFQTVRWLDLTLLYRHIGWNLDSSRIIDHINFSGPTFGLIFRW